MVGAGYAGGNGSGVRDSASSVFLPLKHENASMAWEAPPSLNYDGRAATPTFRDSEETFRGPYAMSHSPTKQPMLYPQSPTGSNFRY
jgi:hypothetical protein